MNSLDFACDTENWAYDRTRKIRLVFSCFTHLWDAYDVSRWKSALNESSNMFVKQNQSVGEKPEMCCVVLKGTFLCCIRLPVCLIYSQCLFHTQNVPVRFHRCDMFVHSSTCVHVCGSVHVLITWQTTLPVNKCY